MDILVTVASLPLCIPSLSSMLVNRFKLREGVQSFSLGGMGCAAGVLGVQLVRDLLKVGCGRGGMAA